MFIFTFCIVSKNLIQYIKYYNFQTDLKDPLMDPNKYNSGWLVIWFNCISPPLRVRVEIEIIAMKGSSTLFRIGSSRPEAVLCYALDIPFGGVLLRLQGYV